MNTDNDEIKEIKKLLRKLRWILTKNPSEELKQKVEECIKNFELLLSYVPSKEVLTPTEDTVY